MSAALLATNTTFKETWNTVSTRYSCFEDFVKVFVFIITQECPSWRPRSKEALTKHMNCRDSLAKGSSVDLEKASTDSLHSLANLQQASGEGSYNKEEGCQSGEVQYPDLQCKKPRRYFKTKEEKNRFVQTYLSKEKTELCKNWEAYHYCKFGDRCSFAHGEKELRSRRDMPPTYKLKQCLQFSKTGLCPYGARCLFIHNSLSLPDQEEASYKTMLEENCKLMEARRNCFGDKDEQLIYVSAYERRRLEVFIKSSEDNDDPFIEEEV